MGTDLVFKYCFKYWLDVRVSDSVFKGLTSLFLKYWLNFRGNDSVLRGLTSLFLCYF